MKRRTRVPGGRIALVVGGTDEQGLRVCPSISLRVLRYLPMRPPLSLYARSAVSLRVLRYPPTRSPLPPYASYSTPYASSTTCLRVLRYLPTLALCDDIAYGAPRTRSVWGCLRSRPWSGESYAYLVQLQVLE
eukprot:3904342-Rhodomonas_salina.3